MTQDQRGNGQRYSEPEAGSRRPAPNRFTWPFKRFFWALEKYLLWPVADSFKWAANGLRYRSPFAYIGATLAFAITVGAVGAAVYFHNQASNQPAVIAQVPEGDAGAVVLPTTSPAPRTPATKAKATGNGNNSGNTLQGVAPSFETAADAKKSKSGPSATARKKRKADKTLVKPEKAPKSGPLKVAHNFATTFVSYEIGRKGASRDFRNSATRKLANALAADPPKQPANGTVPKATVLNVVKGQSKKGKLSVSVALLRLGTSSELRLSLEKRGKGKKKKWRVSEVLG